jgi:hypothetical protein
MLQFAAVALCGVAVGALGLCVAWRVARAIERHLTAGDEGRLRAWDVRL